MRSLSFPLHTARCCHFASCSIQLTRSTLTLFGTVSIAAFLLLPVCLYTGSSLHEKFISAHVKVQPEKHQASSSASGRSRHAGWKHSVLGELLPCALSVSTGILEASICPNTSSKGEQYLHVPKAEWRRLLCPQRYLSLLSCGRTHIGGAMGVLNTRLHKAPGVAVSPVTRGTQGVPGSESRLARTATRVFTWLRPTFRHVHKWTIPSCLLGQNPHWLQWVSACLHSWGLNPQTSAMPMCTLLSHQRKRKSEYAHVTVDLSNTWLHLDSESTCAFLTLPKKGLRITPCFLNKSF